MRIIIAVVLYPLLMALMLLIANGCASVPVVPSLDAIPTSAFDSTMKAVASTNWFGTFCLLAFFGGVVAIGLDQRKIGSAVIIAAISTIMLGLAIHRFPTWLAIVGFASSLIAVGYSILIKKKALVEIIRGVQRARYRVSSDPTLRDAVDDELKSSQSPSTEKVVKQIKDSDAHKN